MKKLKLQDIYKYSSVGNVEFLPDGKRFVFVCKSLDGEKNEYIGNIWWGDTKTGKISQLTRGKKDSSPVPSLDGKTLLFSSERDEKSKGTELYSLPLNGGESRFVKCLKGGFSSINWLDAENILFITQLSQGEDPDKQGEEEPPEKKIYEINTIPFLSNGKGFTQNKIGCLYRLNVETGKLRPIEGATGNVQAIEVSPDRKKVAVVTLEDQERRPKWNSLYVIDLGSGARERIGDDSLSVFQALWSCETELFVLANDFEKGFPTNSYFNFVDLRTKRIESLRRDLDLYYGNSLNSDVRGIPGEAARVSGAKVYTIITAGPDSAIISLDRDGNLEERIQSEGSLDSFDINDSGDLLYTRMSPTEPLELYLEREGKTKKLTNFNSWLKGYELVMPENFKVQASDGATVDGWIMRPVDFREESEYPAVVEIHGGPKTAYGNGYIHEFQTLASEGYAVIYCNPRGSAGYGTDFADIREHYGERDFQDIMEVVEYALNEYDFVDGDRLGVTGGSYGGFMTNWIIGHTDAFKAAVSQRSISNWISFFGTTDIGYYFAPDQTGGDFFENLEGYLRQSPLMYAPNVETPTLFIHSLEDYRCWVPEAMQFFTALRYLGKEAKLILFPKENHELSRSGLPVHREKRLRAILDWFDSHLKG